MAASLSILQGYNSLMSSLPLWSQNLLNLFSLAILILVYAVILWKGHKFISKKNLLDLNLNQYNNVNHPFFSKLVKAGFYLLEYIVIYPLIIFVALGIFTGMLIVLTQNLTVEEILLVSAVVIAAVRMTSYYKEALSREIAKLIPLTVLAVSILSPGFFEFGRVFESVTQLPSLFTRIGIYIFFIVGIEIFLRFSEFIFSLFWKKETIEEN